MTAQRGDWRVEPLTLPQPIPAPSRVWTEAEMADIRRSYVPHMMEEKWFIFMEGNRLFAHRSWTGLGVFEATFAPAEGGYVIESAFVTGEDDARLRDSDEAESRTLERLISGHLLREPPSTEQLAGGDPHTNWELTVPTLPKTAFLPHVIEKADPLDPDVP
ncbi:MAG: hypothetical protein F4Z58_14190 [Acidimicrobiaceae bacterium]|nr:hypothetical protein [Acidimicrobiaceae bacterium]MXW77160.1 hypothetical protein [Acidimicrobiaceae bacterium]MYC42295.1 hypothetical protein [Acidimicrobiaceae bacterium]MYD06366.1 hypothetical protein [Acidimicrobiaceae bacterium]MYH88499.1 hypothetical protein [Acidimicrobiaceae bacterium]